MTTAEDVLADRSWRLRNSIWMAWVFTIFFSWIGIFYIGIRARQRRWAAIGAVLAVPCFVGIAVSDLAKKNQTANTISDVAIGGTLIAAIVAVGLAFVFRDEYLRIRAGQRANSGMASRTGAAKGTVNEVAGATEPSPTPVPSAPVPGTPAAALVDGVEEARAQALANPVSKADPGEDRPGQASRGSAQHADRVDVNHASEADLAALSGIGVVLAKQAVAMRGSGFASVDDFLAQLQLKPHVAEALRPSLTWSPIGSSFGQLNPSGGRVVDF